MEMIIRFAGLGNTPFSDRAYAAIREQRHGSGRPRSEVVQIWEIQPRATSFQIVVRLRNRTVVNERKYFLFDCECESSQTYGLFTRPFQRVIFAE
jgi:hypothetical protein